GKARAFGRLGLLRITPECTPPESSADAAAAAATPTGAYIRQGDGTGSRSEDRPGGGRRRTGDGRAGQRAAQEADKVQLIPHGQGGTKTRGDGRRTDPLDL